jgi:conserved hypothetical protein TIGR03545
MKMIRWSGLGIFVGVIALLIAVTHFFVDSWIAKGIEAVAGDAVGAEVNVSSVSHSYSPFGVTVSGIQITDPAKPTHNQVQLESVTAEIEFLPLLMKKIIIDELAVTGVRFDSQRSKAGEVYLPVESDAPEEAETGMGFDVKLPSVDEVIAKIPLQTDKAKEAVKASYSAHDAKLKEQFSQLPDEKVLQDYSDKIKQLTEKDYKNPEDLLAAQNEFKSLKKSLNTEKSKINNFRKSAKDAQADLSKNIAALQTATSEDYNTLKGMLAGDMAALSEITALVFGEQARAWSKRLLSAYELVVPMLESKKEVEQVKGREEGRWVEFTDASALPDFLIRKADVSLEWQGQGFNSNWKDITTDHDILGRATTFSVDSKNTAAWQSLAVNGDFWLAATGLKANQNWNLQKVLLDQLPLLSENVLNGELTKASLNSVGALKITDGLLDGNGVINLVDMVLKMEGTNKFTEGVADTLNQLTSLKMDAGIAGVLDNPDFSLGSDLDKKIRDSMMASAGSEGRKKLDELQKKLGLRAGEEKGEGNAKLGDWSKLQDLADGKSESVEEMSKAKFEGELDKQKNELEDKLRKKLFN